MFRMIYGNPGTTLLIHVRFSGNRRSHADGNIGTAQDAVKHKQEVLVLSGISLDETWCVM